MAGAAGAVPIAAGATTSSPFPPAAPLTGKSRISSSSLPSSFPSRVRRTNHLRQKILKTLENKPYPDTTHRKITTIPIEETIQQQNPETDQSSISETTGFIYGILGTFSTKSFAKIGLYLVGAFVFQTICAVWILGSSNLDDEDETLSSDDSKKARVNNASKLKLKSKSEPNSLLSMNRNQIEIKEDGNLLVDESEMDNRIVEIQQMARVAREHEKMEAKRKGLVEENDDISHDLTDKSVKEKEVDGRLMKLRKSLEGNYEKPTAKFPTKESDVSKDDDPLMFKKKYKYKSPSVDTGDKPKGFTGTKDSNVANGTLINEINVDDISSDNVVDILDNGSEISVTRDDNKEQEPKGGTLNEPKHDKQAVRAEKSRKSSNQDSRKPRGFGKENSGTTISTKHDDTNMNGSLKGKKGGSKKSARNVDPTDFWWTRLPYVLGVGMQRSGKGEESEGFFTIKKTSHTKNELSHVVAFEDRGDATNFCYLLESFFEDLGDFNAVIVPIPTNELEEEVKSQNMNVVVVKKGQLQLYVGQPLTDVEETLRTLIS